MELKIEFDNRVMKEIEKNLKSLNNSHIEWGWINEKTYPSGDVANRDSIKIAEIARINEYGGLSKSRDGKVVRIPARPYFRQALIATESRVVKSITDIVQAVLHNKPYQHLLEQQARLAALDIILSIKKQNMTPLAQKTIKIKGHDIQWIDTGVMLSNITYRVYKTNIDKAKGV